MKAYRGLRHQEGSPKVIVVTPKKVRTLTVAKSWKFRQHSPTGFEWGYAGSGPAQLALAILLDVTGMPSYSLTHYQQFKADCIARMPKEWDLTEAEINFWIATREKATENFKRMWDSARGENV